MGNLTDFFHPLFQQSRYIRPGGQEFFESGGMNVIKSPYVTGMLCGTFMHVATNTPTPLPWLIPLGIIYAHLAKGWDNNDFDQTRPYGALKIIDKKPDQKTPPTEPAFIRMARIKSISATFWASLCFSGPILGAVESVQKGQDSLLQGFHPFLFGLTCLETMRAIRFHKVARGDWAMHSEPPKKDEPLNKLNPNRSQKEPLIRPV